MPKLRIDGPVEYSIVWDRGIRMLQAVPKDPKYMREGQHPTVRISIPDEDEVTIAHAKGEVPRALEVLIEEKDRQARERGEEVWA